MQVAGLEGLTAESSGANGPSAAEKSDESTVSSSIDIDPLEFAKKCGPRVIFGISGIGKTHLATQHPNLVYDMDRALDRATEDSWPALDPYNRRRAWRHFCKTRPWETLGEPLERWAAIRLRYTGEVNRILAGSDDLLVLTSELSFPWRSELHVGVELGRYVDHLGRIGKIADNGQDEAMNNRIEGFLPRHRLPPGEHFSDVPAIRAWLDMRDVLRDGRSMKGGI